MDELNQRICDLCEEEPPPYDAFGGKPIPYIGRFWREVDFGRDHCWFGVIPPDKDENRPLVGFMENNKWGYPVVKAQGEQWANIKRLIFVALEDPTADRLQAVDEAIQSLIGGKWHVYQSIGE